MAETEAKAKEEEAKEEALVGHTKEQICLAKNMYWEVRKKDLRGMMAVSLVVLNRVWDERWPNTVCGVIEHYKQTQLTLHRCQFSWFCDGKSDNPLKNENQNYEFALLIASSMLDPDCGKMGCIDDFTDFAVLYHNHKVKPKWDYSKVSKTYSDVFHKFYIE